MPTLITDTNLLDPATPYKMLQHHEGNGIIIADIVIFAKYDVSPNSRTIIDRQKLYVKVERGRMLTLHFSSADLPTNLNLQSTFSNWGHSKVFMLNSRVLVHRFDKYPDDKDAVLQTRSGYSMIDGDVLWLVIDQDHDESSIYF